MLASPLRSSLRTPLCRQISSTTSKKAKNAPKVQLPPKKMRALVSLYHESGEFISPENLSDAIDIAFRDQREIWNSWTDRREKSFGTVFAELKERRSLPKLASGAMEAPQSEQGQYAEVSTQGQWSARQPQRVLQLKAALYGTQPANGLPLPGYEVLVEEHERIQELLKKE